MDFFMLLMRHKKCLDKLNVICPCYYIPIFGEKTDKDEISVFIIIITQDLSSILIYILILHASYL